MTRLIEIGGRAYPLRFTARGILKAQARADAPFEALLTGGMKGVCALFYAALDGERPALSLQGAADLCQSAMRENGAKPVVGELMAALRESGFGRAGITQREADALVEAARRAGMPSPESLLDMTLNEMIAAADGYEARLRRDMRLMDALAFMQGAYALRAVHAPEAYPARPCMAQGGRGDMPPDDMKAVLAAWAGRVTHGDA